MKTCHYAVVLLALPLMFLGCGRNNFQNQVLELNSTNVFKVRTCFHIFASRHSLQAPKDQAELVAFLKSDPVNKSLPLIGVDPGAVDEIFVSERDGQPLKIRWGGFMMPDKPMPIAFETVGVDGVRLVAADELLEVDNDATYEKLWKGEYEPAYLEAMKGNPQG